MYSTRMSDLLSKIFSLRSISKEYSGALRKLADIQFPDEMEFPTPPPLNNVTDADFEVGDEIYDDSQSESESEEEDTDETETEEDDY